MRERSRHPLRFDAAHAGDDRGPDAVALRGRFGRRHGELDGVTDAVQLPEHPDAERGVLPTAILVARLHLHGVPVEQLDQFRRLRLRPVVVPEVELQQRLILLIGADRMGEAAHLQVVDHQAVAAWRTAQVLVLRQLGNHRQHVYQAPAVVHRLARRRPASGMVQDVSGPGQFETVRQLEAVRQLGPGLRLALGQAHGSRRGRQHAAANETSHRQSIGASRCIPHGRAPLYIRSVRCVRHVPGRLIYTGQRRHGP